MLSPWHNGRAVVTRAFARSVAAAVFAGLTVTAVPALAHNGVGAAFKGHAGRYVVYAYDGYEVSPGNLEYKIILLDGRTMNPVYDAHPRITAAPPAGGSSTTTAPRTAPITPYGNVFFYDLPNPYPRHWLVDLVITGPLGRGAVSFPVHGATPSARASAGPVVTVRSSQSILPIIVGILGGLVAAAIAVTVVRRHRGATPQR